MERPVSICCLKGHPHPRLRHWMGPIRRRWRKQPWKSASGETQSSIEKVEKMFWDETRVEGIKGETSIIIREHYKENLNKETNRWPLILHPKEVYSLKECPVFLGISIKTGIIYVIIMMNICQATCQALGRGFTSIASPKPHTALWNGYNYHHYFLVNGEPKAKRGNFWRSYSHTRVQLNLSHLSQRLHS